MGFLEDHWNAIKPTITLGVDHAKAVAEAHLLPWNHDTANMTSICEALKRMRPKKVIELGTFEAMGTQRMARALQDTGQEVEFFTVDVGKAPVNSLGETYGVPQVYKDGKMIYTVIPWEEFLERKRGTPAQQTGWGSWGKVMEARERRLRESYGLVRLEFVEGFTYDVLPILLERMGHFDFCFQDTLHAPGDIRKEWEILLPYARVGSIVVFDDMNRGYNRGWVDWFNTNVTGWDTRWAEYGHEPFWVEKIQ